MSNGRVEFILNIHSGADRGKLMLALWQFQHLGFKFIHFFKKEIKFNIIFNYAVGIINNSVDSKLQSFTF